MLDEQLQSVGDDAQPATVDLQNILQKQQQKPDEAQGKEKKGKHKRWPMRRRKKRRHKKKEQPK